MVGAQYSFPDISQRLTLTAKLLFLWLFCLSAPPLQHPWAWCGAGCPPRISELPEPKRVLCFDAVISPLPLHFQCRQWNIKVLEERMKKEFTGRSLPSDSLKMLRRRIRRAEDQTPVKVNKRVQGDCDSLSKWEFTQLSLFLDSFFPYRSSFLLYNESFSVPPAPKYETETYQLWNLGLSLGLSH